MRYFEFKDAQSSKFWEIHDYWNADDKRVEVRYGKIGGAVRTTKYNYNGSVSVGTEIMLKEIEKKLKKGYKEVTKPPVTKPLVTKPIVTKPIVTKPPVTKPLVTKPPVTKPPVTKTKECPPGKVLNPKTGRCINIKISSTKKNSAIKKNSATKKNNATKKNGPIKKECPPGKVLNPKTGRCINIKISSTKKNNSIKKNGPKKKECVVPPSPKPKTPLLKFPTTGVCKSGNLGTLDYNVKEKGVMLAHVYKDANNKIKTPPKGFPIAPDGWWLSEKFDGYRAIWDGKDFRSRNNNIFEAPTWFKDWLPASISLDGELFLGRESFEECGLFRRKVPDDDQWRHAQVKYQIFDSPSAKGTFEERLAFIGNLIKQKCKCVKTKDPCPLILAKQTKVKNEEHVMEIYGTLLEKGAEGVMLRSPGSPYEPKRSSHLLKVKPHFDEECRIIGYKDGTGKYIGKLGAFKCELVKNNKIKFDTSGMNDEIRNNYKTTHPIGTIITFVHMGIMKSGAPRHPNYLRKRLSE